MILANPPLREELAVASAHGISHSHFLGGPRRWSDLDRAKAVAMTRIDRATHADCGTRLDEHGPDWRSDPKFTVKASTCPGCVLIEQAREALPESAKGTMLRLIPIAEFDPDDPDDLLGGG